MSVLVRPNAIALIPLLFALCSGGAAAVPVLEASIGFGGYTAPGRWAPLWIRCADAPRVSSIQVVRVDAGGRETGIESFPALGRTRLECPVLLSDDLSSVKVRLVSGGRKLAELEVDGSSGYFPGHLILAAGLSVASRQAVSAALMPGEPMVVVPVHLSNLPSNGLDYDGVSAVVIADAGGGKGAQEVALLTAGQRNALLAWIAGGGSLVVAAAREGAAGIFEDLGLGGLEGSGESAKFGFGKYGFIADAGKSSEIHWREALDLRPYGSVPSIGPRSVAFGADAPLPESSAASRMRGIVRAALGIWLSAVLAVAFFARKKTAPFALIAGIALVAVLAGGPVLERSFARGSRFKILALALPEAGMAFAAFRAEAYEGKGIFHRLGTGIVGPLSVGFGDVEEGSFGAWNHLLGKGTFSIAGSDQLTLCGLIDPESWRKVLSSSVPPASRTGLLGSGFSPVSSEPPPIESTRPLAYRGAGADGSWWIKEPGASWLRAGRVPDWLAAEESWLVGLARGRRDAAVLAGSCDASLVAFSIQGAPPAGDVVWVMPLRAEAAR